MKAPESTLEPDLITFSTLLKGYCNIGELDKAIYIYIYIHTYICIGVCVYIYI